MSDNIKNKLTFHQNYLEYEVLAKHDPIEADARRKAVLNWTQIKRQNGDKSYLLAVITLSKPDIQGFRHDLLTLQEASFDKVAIVCAANNTQRVLVDIAIETFAKDHPMKVFPDRESALQWLL